MKYMMHDVKMLVSGFGLVVFLMILAISLTLYRIHQNQVVLNDAIEEHQGCIVLIDRMYSASRLRIVILQKISTSTDPFEQDEYISEFRQLASEFIEARQGLLLRNLETEELKYMNMQRDIANYIVPVQEEVIELSLQSKYIEAQVMLVNEVVRPHSEMLETLVALSSYQTNELSKTINEAKQNESRTITILAIVGGVIVLLTIVVAYVLVRNMARVTNHLLGTTETLKDSLRELEYQKRSLDEHAIVSITDEYGEITYVNKKFCEISGYDPEELIGKTHKVVNSLCHTSDYFSEMWGVIQSGKIWKGEIRNKNKQGKLYWMDTTIVPFIDDSGRIYQYAGIQTEITAAKEAKAVLERGKAELEALVDERTIELQERQSLLQQITSSAQDAIVIIDDVDNITFWNESAERIFGYSQAEVSGRKLHDLIMPPRYRPDFESGFSRFIHTGEGQFVDQLREVTAMRRDGSEFPLELGLSSVKLKGRWVGIGLARDITDRKRAEEALKQLALTDQLTGVANRRKFDNAIDVEVQRSARYRFSLSLILFDIDHFKAINDSLGHGVGDAVLCSLATLIEGNIRTVELFARWGGEEFAILLPNCDVNIAINCAEKLRGLIEGFVFPSIGHVTCSFGVAEYRHGESVADLIERADKALYLAKSGGRNCVEVL